MATAPPEMPVWLGDAVKAQGPGFRRATVAADAWERQFAEFSDVKVDFRAFDGFISREEMALLVDSAMRAHRVVDAFVITMVWGHGPSGYGPTRTRKILTQGEMTSAASSRVLANLEASADRAGADDDGYSSFYYLNNSDKGACAGLGPSFFTKWLYAVSAAGNVASPRALPIFDEVVRGGTPGAFAPPLKRAKTLDYVRFVQAIRGWARELSTDGPLVSAAEVEEAVFDHARGYAGEARFGPRDLDGALV